MALTQVQKVEILKFTGWPYGAVEPGHIDFNNKVSSVLDSIPLYLEPMVIDMIAAIKAVDAQQASSVSKHGVKRIDDIEFFEGMSNTGAQQSRKSSLIAELAALLGLSLGPNSNIGSRMGSVCL